MPIIPIDQKKDPEGWHALRQKHIGGSDVAALFNCGSSFTPTVNELYHIKKGNIKNRDSHILAALGKALEPFISCVIADNHAWKIEACEFYHIHPDHPALGCTLDYFVVESEHGPGILEIKNALPYAPGWTNSRAPDHVELQIQHQFLVTNAARKAEGLSPFTWGAIGSMHGGNPEDIRVMLRKPDPKVHKHIIERASRFMADVAAGREPPLLGAADYDHIAGLFKEAPVDEFDAVDMRGDHILDGYMAEFLEAKAMVKKYETDQALLKAKILHRLLKQDGDEITKATAARTDNYVVNVNQIEVNYAARPASQGVQLRFKVDQLLTDI